MTAFEFEELVAKHFDNLGYSVEVSPPTADYGVDVFAKKGKERIAIQAKMYGNTARKVNRKMIMELHGAKDYFDCTKAVMATNGVIIPNAIEVAEKLEIEILHLSSEPKRKQSIVEKELSFDSIWKNHVMPLAGKTIRRSNGLQNKILTVDWSGIERVTSNGKQQRIQIEIFRFTINTILKKGFISRKEINEEYDGRASSGIVLILGNTKVFKEVRTPLGLKLN